MGGKGGGGGGGYYQQPADTSGYGTPEQAKITLAKEAPLDLSQYQQSVNVQKAASEATAKPTIPVISGTTGNDKIDTGSSLADSILKQPNYWAEQNRVTALKPRPVGKSSATTTQT